MQMVNLKLVTIIAEPVLEERLESELHALGATGHTITAARGAGSRGLRASDPPGESVRIEVLAGFALADRIMEHMAGRYFSNYACVAFVSDVSVVRGVKFA
jgi:nitrogen regulatory protein PII